MSGDPDRPYSCAEALEAERVYLRGAGANEADGFAALCLSGGGIRSAAFALGVIEGLAKRNVLPAFDFLSTVSGGGFAGGWLSAWLYHAAAAGDREKVFRQLRGMGLEDGRTEASPISHMRAYSRYMSPQLGGLSADSWTLVATMLRNIFLNWMVLLPLVAAALLVPRVYLELVQAFDRPLLASAPAISVVHPSTLLEAARMSPAATWLLIVSTILQFCGAAYMVTDLPSYGNRRRSQSDFLLYCLTPLVLGTVGLTLFWPLNVVPLPFTFISGVAVVASVGTWMVFGLSAGTRKFRPRAWVAAAMSAPIAATGLWWLTSEPFGDGVPLGLLYCTLAFPLALGSIAVSNMVFVALSTSDNTEADLEWHSRYNAWLFITIVAWLGITTLVFFAPPAFRWLRDLLSEQLAIERTHATGILGGAGSMVAAFMAYWLRRPVAPIAADQARWQSVAMSVAAPFFLVLLLGAIAWANAAAINQLYAAGRIAWMHDTAGLAWLSLTPAGRFADDATAAEVFVVAAALVFVGSVMARFVPVNTFSLHGMYRERLIRAFLGASRAAGARRPNPFTGFDVSDNLPMHVLRQSGRPLHVVNTTLNRVAEKGLAMQFRKSESFTITPLHAGAAAIDSYRPSERYADDRLGGAPSGVSLGKALAISGAAASPNMGSRSTPTLTFLMTLFNARLGVWTGNPGTIGRHTWTRSEPQLGVGPLISELCGRTTDQNPYVYLSDGGHFENLGLWEMVRRRCRWVLVSDAGCDPGYTFSDLATAVRLIRIDFGIPIVFDEGIEIDGTGKAQHFAVGRIQYSTIDPLAEDGILVYLKATLSGNEPIDVRNYAKGSPAFPHESTADQWFTEAQFESYRTLGQYSAMLVAEGYAGDAGLPGFFKWAAKQSRMRAAHSFATSQTTA